MAATHGSPVAQAPRCCQDLLPPQPSLSSPNLAGADLLGPRCCLFWAHHPALSELSPWRGGSCIQCLPTLKPRSVAKISLYAVLRHLLLWGQRVHLLSDLSAGGRTKLAGTGLSIFPCPPPILSLNCPHSYAPHICSSTHLSPHLLVHTHLSPTCILPLTCPPSI